MKTRNLLWLPVVLLMAACGDEEEGSVVSSMPIQFSAEISASRVTGDSWEIGDRIGISMSGAETKTNLPYVTVQTDGKFSAEGEELRFPDVPGDVVFHAYYPYSETLNGNMLTFNADGKTDVLWAEKSVSAEEQTAAAVSLEFSHVLSKVLVKTTGFAEDVEVALEGASYNQATLNITDGTVAGAGEPEETSFFLLATSNPGEFSAIFLPETTAGTKTLVVTSESEGREWRYDLSSFTFVGGTQNIYEIDRSNAGIKFTSTIIPWTSGEPADLKDPEGGPITMTIKRLLAGKTYTPDTDYYYDQVNLEGKNGYTYDSGNGFGENVENNWKWNADLKEKCEKSSITFHYEGGRLTADALDNGTEKKGIEVTVDENDRTLTFSQAPFTFHGHFTDNWVGGYVQNGENPYPEQVGTVWYLFAQTPGTEAGSFILGEDVTNVEDLFTTGMHWAYHLTWEGGSGNYRVLNFVEK